MTKHVVNPEGTWAVTGRSYNHVVKVASVQDLIFVAGVGAVTPEFTVLSDDIREQTRFCFELIRRDLEAAGAGLEDVCDMTVYLKDIVNHQWPFREVRSEFFDASTAPVSTMVEVSRFTIDGLLVEIDVIAAR